MTLIKPLYDFCSQQLAFFDSIEKERKELLEQLSKEIQILKDSNATIRLNYICTHNSRRSHIGQIAGALAAFFYEIPNVQTFSGGTEVTAFNPNAIQAFKYLGFEISVENSQEPNPHYFIKLTEGISVECFSKTYNDSFNPSSDFIALMTCDDADQKCPFIPGASLRVPLRYKDPKVFDGTPQQLEGYVQRIKQITTEQLYLFSLIR
jgi:protein-tyrosine-phosphatase